MKTLRALPIALLLTGTLAAQTTKKMDFTIKGKIDALPDAKVILTYSTDDKRISDTTALKEGTFSFKGKINRPVRSIIMVVPADADPRMRFGMGYAGEIIGRDGVSFYLDKGTISFKGQTLKEAAITGSKAQKEFEAYQLATKPVIDKLNAIQEEMKPLAKDREGEAYKALMEKLMATMKETSPISDAFVQSHPNSWVAMDRVTGTSIISNPKHTEELFNSISASLRNSEEGKQFQERLQKAFTTAIGAQAPLFSQNNTDGAAVSLASLKGKYVLIDFWASWCGPCRAENPNVKIAYDKFKNRNFEILAVSLDDKKDAWLKAIHDDGLTWMHVSDLKGWKNEVAEQYNVRAVPQNFLLDPNGVIIATNMRGKELEEKLGALVK